MACAWRGFSIVTKRGIQSVSNRQVYLVSPSHPRALPISGTAPALESDAESMAAQGRGREAKAETDGRKRSRGAKSES
eukprot:scaffold1178_cov252-Pinguiococcus_pyrenoidosus.AAC.20